MSDPTYSIFITIIYITIFLAFRILADVKEDKCL